MNKLYYEVMMDYNIEREVMVVYDKNIAIDVCFSFSELFKKYPAIESKEFLELTESDIIQNEWESKDSFGMPEDSLCVFMCHIHYIAGYLFYPSPLNPKVLNIVFFIYG